MSADSLPRRFLSLLLALLVLAASVGITVRKQTCLLSGCSQVALSVVAAPASSLCRGTATPLAITDQGDDCCDFSLQLHKVSTPALKLAAKVLLPAAWPAAGAPVPAWPLAKAAVPTELVDPRRVATASLLPPLGGRELLRWACTMVV